MSGPENRPPAAVPLPVPWVTHLDCPTCGTPEALRLFEGVGTVCTECGDATRTTTTDAPGERRSA